MFSTKDSDLDYIKIGGLHGYRNFDMHMEDRYKILLSENGQGKTTILKLIDAILSGDAKRLNSINFESVELKFHGSEPLRIFKKEIFSEVPSDSSVDRYLLRKIPESIFKNIKEVASKTEDKNKAIKSVKNYLEDFGIKLPIGALNDFVDECHNRITVAEANDFFASVRENCKYESLYLPTYRRIEDELSDLATIEEVSLRQVIQFGLGDVERKISSMKASTLATSNESMVRINGEILTRLVNGLSVIEDDKAIIRENSNLIELVLKRVGHTLSERDKDKIINLVQSGSIFSNVGNDPLIYFLSNMYKAFLDQRLNDEALGAFSKICSSYFANKEMNYDERELVVKITSKETGNEIKFNQLSSGEKQIVSLFSKLYLDSGPEFFILFDEPELSLSVEWQRKIIHDVIASPRCGTLIAMTHSPFIFNGLSEYTSDLGSYITRMVK